jgi:hypothetical protein
MITAIFSHLQHLPLPLALCITSIRSAARLQALAITRKVCLHDPRAVVGQLWDSCGTVS